MNADAEQHLLIGRPTARGLGACVLPRDGAGNGVDGAGKCNEKTVASAPDELAAMAGDKWINDSAAQRLQLVERTNFIVGHEPRIAHNVGGQHGRQTAGDIVVCGALPCCQGPFLWSSTTDWRLPGLAASLG